MEENISNHTSDKDLVYENIKNSNNSIIKTDQFKIGKGFEQIVLQEHIQWPTSTQKASRTRAIAQW